MRIVIFLIVSVGAFVLPWWAGLMLMTCYALFYTAYEIIVLGALLDAQFGVSLTPFFYTLSAGGIFIVLEFVKPFLSFYEETA